MKSYFGVSTKVAKEYLELIDDKQYRELKESMKLGGKNNDETDLIQDLVEITFPEKDDFLKIRETLSRIGVASRKEKELFQSCHILHKKANTISFTSKSYSN